MQAFSSCSKQGCSPTVVCRLLIAVAFLVTEHRLGCMGLLVVMHPLVAPRHMESPWIRGQTHVPCIGRQDS